MITSPTFTITQQREFIVRIKRMLKQKRHCFWYARIDAQKQQLVLNAEHALWKIESCSPANFPALAKEWSTRFIHPLLGSPDSKYHKHYLALYEEIQTL